MKRNKKQLPENVSVPEDSILSEETYEHIFALISNQSNYMKLKELYEESQSLNGVWDESKYQALIDAGLAARKTGAGNPYIEITSIGETLVKHGVQTGLEKLIEEEHNLVEEYDSDVNECDNTKGGI